MLSTPICCDLKAKELKKSGRAQNYQKQLPRRRGKREYLAYIQDMKFLDWYIKLAVGFSAIGAAMEYFMIQTGFCVSEPLVRVLRLVDGEQNIMGYIYEAMDRAKEAIQNFYRGDAARFGPFWDLIDRRWNNQLHQPIHAAGYYLNPKYFFSDSFADVNGEIMEGLSTCIERMTPDIEVRDLIISELQKYKHATGRLFSSGLVIRGRSTQQPDDKVTVLEAEKRAEELDPRKQAIKEALNPWGMQNSMGEKNP